VTTLRFPKARPARWFGAACAIAALAAAPGLRAEDARTEPPSPVAKSAASPPAPAAKIPTKRKALAAATAIVPGLIVHGTGHLVAGHTRTGLTLLGAQGLGLGLLLAGLGSVAATGATRRFVGPLIIGTVSGATLFFLSALADIYGVLAPEGGTGRPPAYLPSIETQLGLAYVHDPNFAYNTFLVPGVDLRHGSLRASALGFYALDDANSRTRVELAYRFFGPRPRSAEARSEPCRRSTPGTRNVL
jgi:hypothetical protein